MIEVAERVLTTVSCRVWLEDVSIPTYPAAAPDPNPMFLEKRVYQGSSGRVYPCPFTDRVSTERVERTYRAVFLENEYLFLMILPEIGGRIHVAQDRTNGYDFFYRQRVIKPALVGLLGPWISGGVEFNWPQHHRPSTFMPVEFDIEEHLDGAVTLWLSEHEPMNRMKGMAGITIRPGSAVIELSGQLHNRTPFTQTFLWWANVCARVNDDYQSFFPPDVSFVADHAKRAISAFPECTGIYYGVDYRPGTRLDWYKNIPVPTSYMVTQSKYNFFGGYDHGRRAGFVHVADRRIAPGKKQWTWGDAPFGHAWDRNLTDEDGPYVELMAGVFTDNQPDFSWLTPFETKTFTQAWYPIQEIGPAKNANLQAAVNLEVDGGEASLGVAAPVVHHGLRVSLEANGTTVFSATADVAPGRSFTARAHLPAGVDASALRLSVTGADGREIISYQPEEANPGPPPLPAKEPLPPAEMTSLEDLYLTGLHLEQYRHATRDPEPYWREALRRDPGESRVNTALGRWQLRRGLYEQAQAHFRAAIGALTRLNPNPENGEAHYYLGVTLRLQGRREEAYDALYKAAWNGAWAAAARYGLAQLDAASGAREAALAHLNEALAANARHTGAANLKTALLRGAGRLDEARTLAARTRALDRLDFWSRREEVLISRAEGREHEARVQQEALHAILRGDPQNILDLTLEYADAGLNDDATAVLEESLARGGEGARYPMLHYTLAFLHARAGNAAAADSAAASARACPPEYFFPNRPQEIEILQAALARRPDDARASYALGNLYYDRRRYEEAISLWETAARAEPGFATPWRNLGLAYFNARGQAGRALKSYQRAFKANPTDARVLYELDQLAKRMGQAPDLRLRRLERQPSLLNERDDLSLERAALLNAVGRPRDAIKVLESRAFSPWEGGEGQVLGEYERARIQLGHQSLAAGQAQAALAHFSAALQPPQSLGEARHALSPQNAIHYGLGLAHAALGQVQEARTWLELAARPTPAGEASYWQAEALKTLGQKAEARAVIKTLLAHARDLLNLPGEPDYFATSLPNLLIFNDDLLARNLQHSKHLMALADLAAGRTQQALRQLQAILQADPGHAGAADALRILGTRKGKAFFPPPQKYVAN